jgi:two-component system CheB/CheR fusion protein
MGKSKGKKLKPTINRSRSDDKNTTIPIVAIGASAGGLEALQRLFSKMPLHTGLAFIVITHQKQGRVSLLPELLKAKTEIPVSLAENLKDIEVGNIYVAPCEGRLSIEGSRFLVLPFDTPKESHDIYHPIDYFFRSLAEQCTFHAIGIVLSGSGNDGSVGLLSIKENGGLVIAEDPTEASFLGMPSSAIATGLVDYTLKVEDIPPALCKYVETLKKQSSWAVGKNNVIPSVILDQIYNLLYNQTGHDFSGYKTSTLFRRIERRMSLHQIYEPHKYLNFLKLNPQEVDLLFKELLIRVTHFFRDPELWESLAQKTLIELFKTCPIGSTFRIWVPGCATGEEAYTLAILARECMQRLNKFIDVQIFGTDLDAAAINIARKGVFPDGISEDLSHNRLQKFFTHKDNSYTICKEIREMMIFATQNIIKDPPFTNIDLISCRNLLIYMKSELQQKVLSIFHYGLKPKGLLILGPSETVGNLSALFDIVDIKNKIYRQKLSEIPYNIPELTFKKHSLDSMKTNELNYNTIPRNQSFTQSVLKMLTARFAPVCIIINYLGEIHYIHGKTGAYLEMGEGRPRNNLLDMAREGLRIELSSALRAVAGDEQVLIDRRIRINNDNVFSHIDFTLERIHTPETLRGLLLVTLTPLASHKSTQKKVLEKKISTTGNQNNNIEELNRFEKELQIAQESYRTILEEFETSNEELKSTNEELQSTNEELQSSNEELETSREEMQSLNEELSTVNAELQSKLDELSQANDDMQNLLNSTDIATIFLDDKLCIKRFTNQASKLIALRQTDLGRPIVELASTLRYETMVDDARSVLQNLIPIEAKIQTKSGAWYLMRILPYRTTENVINGLVCSFIDIANIKLAELQGDYFKGIVNSLHESIIVLNDDFVVCSANTAFFDMLHLKTNQVINRPFYDIDGGSWNIPTLRNELDQLKLSGKQFNNIEIPASFYTSGNKQFYVNGQKIVPSDGAENMIILTITERS